MFRLVSPEPRTILTRLMLFLAASALQKAADLPSGFWLKVIVVFACFIGVILVLRWLAQQNKVLMLIVAIVVTAIVGFQWIYERNEPEFLTPVVDKIAPFFPSKGEYGGKQQEDPKTPGAKKGSPARPTPANR